MTFHVRKFLLLVTFLLFALIAWLLCIDLGSSVYWRVWHFNNTNISTVWIGLWKFCYLQWNFELKFELTYPTVICMKINSSWVFPQELKYSQDLITLSIFLQMIGQIFSFGAFLMIFKNESYPYFIDTCHLIAGCCFIISGISISISVICNTYMDITDISALELPQDFPVKWDTIIYKEIGLAFPMGISSAVCSFISGVFFFCHSLCSKFSRVHPQDNILNSK
ncbi:claudin-4-like [Sarcophilus harrisii]|uniref:Claudin n=1 Tax=Sarcophilus harrisii TaxID=9305 RepID=A0A7N4V429_SARHA|nr:claudin-4-like [Sarcophilus harrisii]